MNKRGVLVVALLSSVCSIGGTVATCSYKSLVRNAAFDAVALGDLEASVIAKFGTQPSVSEKQGALFARYASQPCSGECEKRLWFENRLSLDTEAWSIELDGSGRVIRKSRWISP